MVAIRIYSTAPTLSFHWSAGSNLTYDMTLLDSVAVELAAQPQMHTCRFAAAAEASGEGWRWGA
jgi:hypothetical protein